ncbi:MAG: outer membrane protein assembly factor BamD [Myxococcales bacterium FL481]|nr:MAG: outer membrane protein assembly factor BamD [Myxococcales bacterium FL481]
MRWLFRRPGERSPDLCAKNAKRSKSASRACIRQLLVASAVVASGCATAPDLAAQYGQTARENYELAEAEFKDRDWEEATTFADFVRVRFPFSRYAVEAELLVARADFELKNYTTAADAFKMFAKLHPTHKHVRNGWVSYMTAVCAVMAAPDDVIFLPPHYQRDQSQLKVALDEIAYFFDHHPDSELAVHAAALRDDVQRRLLEHELYVAQFYLDRDRPYAAVGRLEAAHARFPGAGFDADILFMLGITYLRMDEVELARNTFSKLQVKHPQHHHGKQARIYLNHIYKTYGPADPSRPRPDYKPPRPKPPPRPKTAQGKSANAQPPQR